MTSRQQDLNLRRTCPQVLLKKSFTVVLTIESWCYSCYKEKKSCLQLYNYLMWLMFIEVLKNQFRRIFFFTINAKFVASIFKNKSQFKKKGKFLYKTKTIKCEIYFLKSQRFYEQTQEKGKIGSKIGGT